MWNEQGLEVVDLITRILPVNVSNFAPDLSRLYFIRNFLNKAQDVQRSLAGHRACACGHWDFVAARYCGVHASPSTLEDCNGGKTWTRSRNTTTSNTNLIKHSLYWSCAGLCSRWAQLLQLALVRPSTLALPCHTAMLIPLNIREFSTRTPLPVFTIRMPKVKLSLVKPELTRDLPKVRHLSLGPLVLQLFRRSLDLGEFSCSLLKEEDEPSRKFAPEISRLFREEFIPNRKLRKYIEEIDGYVQHEV
jgi:hypothetical protein